MMEQAHIAWCRQVYELITEGGTWAVPRSGLIFQKINSGIVLIEEMPWTGDMPISREQLREQQDGDYEAIREHFEAAGISVSRSDLTQR